MVTSSEILSIISKNAFRRSRQSREYSLKNFENGSTRRHRIDRGGCAAIPVVSGEGVDIHMQAERFAGDRSTASGDAESSLASGWAQRYEMERSGFGARSVLKKPR
ncbi:hypothetical protein [Mesorhizobium loti]|uniref:hypothetical protein n=1 Tax=Rhizobium loti TaxID=381 RepID=UPI0011B77CB4|nr:hypothetical protein [Mesorhizobium loti]